DLALNFVVKELSLWKVARYLPQTMSDLNHLELENPAIRFHGRTMLQMVEQAKKLPESECPAPLSRLVDNPEYKATLKEIKAFIATLETETGLSGELLASRRQIHQLLSFAWKSTEHVDSAESDQGVPELLSGWRGDLMGERLQKLLSKSI
ncbi:MAG: ribonuclease D, partial [Plesiomonas sp.]